MPIYHKETNSHNGLFPLANTLNTSMQNNCAEGIPQRIPYYPLKLISARSDVKHRRQLYSERLSTCIRESDNRADYCFYLQVMAGSQTALNQKSDLPCFG